MFFLTPADWVRHVQSTHTEDELAKSNSNRKNARRYATDQPHTIELDSADAGADAGPPPSRPPPAPISIDSNCPFCKKTFASYASMLVHRRRHTGK